MFSKAPAGKALLVGRTLLFKTKTFYMRSLFIIPVMLVFIACNQSKTKEKKEATQKDSSNMVSDSAGANKNLPQRAMLPDEAMINGLLKSKGHEKWRLITDAEARVDSFNYYVETVGKARVKNPDFPFIAKGDFNGDGKMDYAALVMTDEKFDTTTLTKVVIFLADGDMIITEADSDNHTTVDLSPKSSKVHGFLDGKTETDIKLKYDAVDVSNWDAGGDYIYWDGKKWRKLHDE